WLLSKREREAVERVGRGYSNKQIAYELGVSTGTVARHLSQAAVKLGSRSRLEMLRAVRAEGAAFKRFATVGSEAVRQLTSAERQVMEQALAGLSNHAIAQLRGSSRRTVANQLASVYRKLQVNSRSELAVLLDPPLATLGRAANMTT